MRLLIVDDHPLVREALGNVLRSLRPDAAIGEASTAAQALSALRESPPVDLLLLDIRLPDQSGLDLLPVIAERHVGTAVVVLVGRPRQRTPCSAPSPPVPSAAFPRPSRGKCSPARSAWCSPAASTFRRWPCSPEAPAAGDGRMDIPPRAGRAAPTPADLGLTGRQVEVLALLMQGKNNKLICRALGLAEPTVKSHVSAILRALNVESRTEAVLAVTRLGWSLPSIPQAR
jgi:DNA-binding NarL/FixJ family response regulator